MKAAEIRKESENNAVKLYSFCDGSDRMLQLLQYAAQMEIAAQLAELNEQLHGMTWDVGSSVKDAQLKVRVNG